VHVRESTSVCVCVCECVYGDLVSSPNFIWQATPVRVVQRTQAPFHRREFVVCERKCVCKRVCGACVRERARACVYVCVCVCV